MISKFIDFLNKNYSKNLSVISKTASGKNFIVNDDFKMIFVDEMAKEYPGENLSTVDGLYACESNGLFHFYFVEFKRMNLDYPYDLPISLTYLKKARKEISCDDFCNFIEVYDGCESYLSDKNKVNLRIKPLSTLILLYHLYHHFRKHMDFGLNFKISDFKEKIILKDLETIKTFSNIKFHYIIVYLDEFNKISPNKSCNHTQRDQYFGFLDKLIPYPFYQTCYCNDRQFENKILKNLKKCS